MWDYLINDSPLSGFRNTLPSLVEIQSESPSQVSRLAQALCCCMRWR